MIALIQRVSQAEVRVGTEVAGAIDRGVLAFIGVQKEDTESDADRLLERLLTYRIFPDELGRMNLDVRAVGGGVLLVPQFTLAADTRSGTRPGFSKRAVLRAGVSLGDAARDPDKGVGGRERLAVGLGAAAVDTREAGRERAEAAQPDPERDLGHGPIGRPQ